MILTMMKGKIYRAAITRCDIHYEGSISIDAVLMESAGILPNEQVDVLDITNGARFTTYAIEAEPGTGMIGVNGAAARLVQLGDLVIVIAYAQMDEAEARRMRPRVVMVDAKNRIA